MTLKVMRQKAILICVVTILVLGGWAAREYWFVNEAKKSWAAKNRELETLKAKIKLVSEEIGKYEKEKADFQQFLFAEQDVPTFLDSISEYARKTKVNIQDMKTKRFQSVVLPKEISESQSRLSAMKAAKAEAAAVDSQSRLKRILTLAGMPINIRVEGTFANLVEFLGYLDDFKQLLTITNVEIAVTKNYPVLRCKFTLTIYSLKTIDELEYK